MAFNGAGVFVRLYNWVTDKANGIKVRADRMDAEFDGIATGLSNCVTKDGQTTITANLPMAGFKLTGLGAGTANGDSVRFEQVLRNAGASWTAEVAVASAGTCDILGAASERIEITGTTTITSFGTGTNKVRLVRFAGALTLTHNATSLILPGAANITTAAGDTCIVVSDGSSNARVLAYQKASGLPVGTGTSGTKVPLLDGANTWSGAQTFDTTSVAAALAILQCTEDSASAGPIIPLRRISASPAVSDTLAELRWDGRSSLGATRTYGRINSVILDPTDASEDGDLRIGTIVAGTMATRMTVGQGVQVGSPTGGDKGDGTINAAGSIYVNNDAVPTLGVANNFTAAQTITISAAGADALVCELSEDSATTGPYITLRRISASPAANDGLGLIRFNGRDSAANTHTYAFIQGTIVDHTDASEDGRIDFQTTVAGTNAVRAYFAQGLVVGSPTGSDKGVGTINATAVYDDNVLLTCYVLEAFRTGKIDLAAWDARVPNRQHPAEVALDYELCGQWDDDGNGVGAEEVAFERVVAPAREEVREHLPARRFAASRMDELEPEAFAAKWIATGVLPGMPTPDEWASAPESAGAMVQRLWELCELYAVHIKKLTDRVAALEGR